MPDYAKIAIEAHKKLRGKLRVMNADTLDSIDKLSTYYTPGVGAVSKHIAENPKSARELTGINNTVLVVSDGSAVLGLGNIGPQASLPVMEGKCMLFQEFAGINAFPIVLESQDPDRIIATVSQILPSVGGINLEDIAAPICFEVENKLKEISNIPIFHDDQHGTAIVVLAGLINAAKVVGKNLNDLNVAIAGAGAAGNAVANLLHNEGLRDILVLDSKGIISSSSKNLREDKKQLANITNPRKITGDLKKAIKDADVFVGVSQPDLLNASDIRTMANKPIVMALSNPHPEILPDEAKKGGAAVVATGRSDFPNQVNNALAFPAIFRGALDNQVTQITDDHKIAAAHALAGLVKAPTAEMIIPSISNQHILEAVSSVIV